MPSNILFVFEGERTENRIAQSLTNLFFQGIDIIHCAYCSDIYRLYKEIDEDEYLDIFSLLKELPVNEETLKPFGRNNFAEIYMFFDYDGHATMADDGVLRKMLMLFNEETEYGKLLISYPMVEALKHLPKDENFEQLKVRAKENIRYKEIVDISCDIILKQINKYDKNIWIRLIKNHLYKLNFIVNDSYSFPSKNINQHEILHKQLKKYINTDSTVAVLSSFPIFLFDYYGGESLSKLIPELDTF